MITYENKTAHHVHGGTQGAEKDDLVGGDHPLAAGLVTCQSCPLSIAFPKLVSCNHGCCLKAHHTAFLQSSRASSSSLSTQHLTSNAPSPRSSGHRASGTRAGTQERCFRGRPSCVLSVPTMTVWGRRRCRAPIRFETVSRSCGEDVPCHCEGWKGVCAGSRGQWVVWCCVGQSEVASNDPAAEGAMSGLGASSRIWARDNFRDCCHHARSFGQWI